MKPTKSRFFILALSFLIIGLLTTRAAVAQQYSVTDLGALFAPGYSTPLKINNLGQVVGFWDNYGVTPYKQYGFMYNNGSMAYLNVGTFSSASGINDLGQIAGEWDSMAFVYYNQQNATFLMPGVNSSAAAINNLGQVAGSYMPDFECSECYSGFVYSGGVITTIPSLGPCLNSTYNFAYDINNSGLVVGKCSVEAFMYQNGALTDLGPGAAYAVNNKGQVVGSNLGQGIAALFYTGGSRADFSFPGAFNGTVAYGINDSGQIVGEADGCFTDGYCGTHAFIYNGGVISDLNTLIPQDSG